MKKDESSGKLVQHLLSHPAKLKGPMPKQEFLDAINKAPRPIGDMRTARTVQGK